MRTVRENRQQQAANKPEQASFDKPSGNRRHCNTVHVFDTGIHHYDTEPESLGNRDFEMENPDNRIF